MTALGDPEGVDVSSLDHILGPHATVPADRSLFLPETWQLHPLICAFNSEMFYESRLHPHDDVQPLRRPSWHGVSLQRQLPERCHFACEMHLCRRRITPLV